MRPRIAELFVKHWFIGVFALIFLLWIAADVAYLLGADGFRVRSRSGAEATIDFRENIDRHVVELESGIGLEINHSGPELRGSVVKLRQGFPVLCWICGQKVVDQDIGIVEFQSGDWLFRAPSDQSNNPDALHGREAYRALILTLAYNSATGERLMAAATDTVDTQARALATRGLAVSEAARLTPESLADLPLVSMQGETCMIINLAFVSVVLLWLFLGGLALFAIRLLRRRSSRAPASTARPRRS